jgi:hypothetical protein
MSRSRLLRELWSRLKRLLQQGGVRWVMLAGSAVVFAAAGIAAAVLAGRWSDEAAMVQRSLPAAIGGGSAVSSGPAGDFTTALDSTDHQSRFVLEVDRASRYGNVALVSSENRGQSQFHGERDPVA